MPKRKRDSPDSALDDVDTGGSSLLQRRVQHKLEKGVVHLGHTFKIAKGFERQKLGRRRKQASAQSKHQDVERIDAEIAALKALDSAKLARSYLYKTLARIKAVNESPNLPGEVRKHVTLSTDLATLNVHGRLCNSNPVKEALPGILDDIQRALGIHTKRARLSGREQDAARTKTQSTIRPDELSVNDGGDAKLMETGGAFANFDDEDEDEDDEWVGTDEHVLSDDEDEDLDRFNGRLASPDDEDGEDVASEEDGLKLQARGGAASAMSYDSRDSTTYDHTADLDLSSNPPSPTPSPEPQKARPTVKKSAFLPSLSMGGYISGSDSDMDDEDMDAPPKKNRRGQRARQQIWEKKYGARAKHLQKQKVEWDAKRGAVDVGRGKLGDKGSKAMRRSLEPNGRTGGEAKQPVPTQRQQPRDDNKPLHPSWEAAKKAKLKSEAAPLKFQGKKITFD